MSADVFIVRAVIHSTLCKSCLFDRVTLGFHLRARRREDCNYPDWILAEMGGVTFRSANTAAVSGQVSRRER